MGVRFEIAISYLADLIARSSRLRGEIIFDTTKSDGQPRRMVDTSKIKEGFGFEPKTSFEEGIAKTDSWNKKQLGNIITS